MRTKAKQGSGSGPKLDVEDIGHDYQLRSEDQIRLGDHANGTRETRWHVVHPEIAERVGDREDGRTVHSKQSHACPIYRSSITCHDPPGNVEDVRVTDSAEAIVLECLANCHAIDMNHRVVSLRGESSTTDKTGRRIAHESYAVETTAVYRVNKTICYRNESEVIRNLKGRTR